MKPTFGAVGGLGCAALLWVSLAGWAASVPPPGEGALAASAIFSAVKGGDGAAVKALLATPGTAAVKDEDGMGPLHYAAFKGELAIAEMLVAAGADVNGTDDIGMTPLHAAAFDGRWKVAAFLLDMKARIDATDSFGMTPLHYAAACGHLKTIELLLEHGANPALKDGKGRTPLDLARKEKRGEAARMIQGASKAPPKPAHVYTDEDITRLRNQGILLPEGDPTHRTNRRRSQDYGTKNIERMEAEIHAKILKRRDLEAGLPDLKRRCEEARVDSAAIVDTSSSSDPVGSYSRGDEIRRRRAAQQACYAYERARNKIRYLEQQIEYYRKQIDRLRSQGHR